MTRRFTDDDETDGGQVRSHLKVVKKPAAKIARELGSQEGNATVTAIFPNQASARLDADARIVLCNYRMSTLVVDTLKRERSPVCVGDRVRVEAGVIVGRCARRNRLVRSTPNPRDPLLHVLAANLDFLVIVAAAREPEFSCGIIDRFLVAASAQRIEQVLVINKTDLRQPDESRPWSHYPDAGVTVIETSAHDGSGVDRLLTLLSGKTAAFCGHSWVGKTSLLRQLLADNDYGRVAAISAMSGKGRHTTSGAVLLAGPGASSLIDTPGVMNFGLIDIAADGLLVHFPELHKAAAGCAADCLHDAEPDCALRALPRYGSYRAILSSLR